MKLFLDYTPVDLPQESEGDFVLHALEKAAKDLGLVARIRDIMQGRILIDAKGSRRIEEYSGSEVDVTWHGLPYLQINGKFQPKGKPQRHYLTVWTGILSRKGFASKRGIEGYLNQVNSHLKDV